MASFGDTEQMGAWCLRTQAGSRAAASEEPWA